MPSAIAPGVSSTRSRSAAMYGAKPAGASPASGAAGVTGVRSGREMVAMREQ